MFSAVLSSFFSFVSDLGIPNPPISVLPLNIIYENVGIIIGTFSVCVLPCP